ncbi:ribosome-associated translation inhibitor RaiA [candidate division KSB1 bacterium]|nr:ribosome-associated translation inhibitor RaiA [candidate division KSB1 bacterium]NIR72417.1 ribosome-associated translation inhibitor RaiA [candidate division KSB1 bacterium]NIS23582.1 ribosome-associated translation inhibitor RaiA [candidate division KSB1 bacterium]NIT70508.1 ribosome-associated translation inhibitor RaiA [candidate division KSB1 bacterium]NIU24216.1 ribosome-associated translation inhibitor RaiA [candidate division KSB1 bacterium]
MRISFTARHFKAADGLKDYAEKKARRLKRYYNGIIDCEIVLDYEKQDQIAEIAIKVYGQKLVAVEKTEDIFKSIDQAVDKLERQVKKYKGKLRGHTNARVTSLEYEGGEGL